MQDEDWKEAAACRDKGPDSREDGVDIFFPERGENSFANEAMVVCFTCPVRPECDEYRKRTNTRYGVWAGQIQTQYRNED